LSPLSGKKCIPSSPSSEEHPTISAIVLAAGSSSRMHGAHKLLKPFRSKTILEEVLSQLKAASPDEIIVVTGHQQEAIAACCSSYISQVLFNERFEHGMTSSIQKGLTGVSPYSKGYMIVLGDMPLIAAATYQAVMESFKNQFHLDHKTIIIPTIDGVWGHPKVFSTYYKHAIEQHLDPEGCKQIIRENKSHVLEIALKDRGILIDIDTPTDYDEYRGTYFF